VVRNSRATRVAVRVPTATSQTSGPAAILFTDLVSAEERRVKNVLPPEFEEGWRYMLADLEQQFGTEAISRLSQLKLGQSDRADQQPTLAYLPGLSATPWWDEESSTIGAVTAWMEDRFDTILEETLASTRPNSEHVEGYPHMTLGGDLADGWDVVFLCKSRNRIPEVIARHPTPCSINFHGSGPLSALCPDSRPALTSCPTVEPTTLF
jgi:hypothetical protein